MRAHCHIVGISKPSLVNERGLFVVTVYLQLVVARQNLFSFQTTSLRSREAFLALLIYRYQTRGEIGRMRSDGSLPHFGWNWLGPR
jgi:hypothetical protein